MDIGEIIVRGFSLIYGIHESRRTEKRARERSAELKELGDKIALRPATALEPGNKGNIIQNMEKSISKPSQALLEGKSEVSDACIPCALGHFSASSGLLKEMLRFKGEGIASNALIDRIAGVLEEQNALEREDLTPDKIERLPKWQKPIAEEALTQSRQLRHRLEAIQSTDELQQLAADTRSYYIKLSRQWYKGRFRPLGDSKAEAIASRVGR